MGKGRHEVASQERRAKRLAIRYGLHLMKSQKPFGKIAEHGGYMLRDEDTRENAPSWQVVPSFSTLIVSRLEQT